MSFKSPLRMFQGIRRSREMAMGSLEPSLFDQLLQYPVATDVALEWEDATHRYLWVPILHEYWTRWRFMKNAVTGVWTIISATICSVLDAVNDDDAGITYNGVWNVNASGSSLGGQYHYAQGAVTGRYVEFNVTPGAGDRIYVVIVQLSNCGYASVTINGGIDLVNEIETVGGQKLISCYAAGASYNQRILIASSLDPGTSYTVRLTCTGTKPPASSDVRVYFEGYGIVATNVDSPGVTGVTNARKATAVPTFGSNTTEYAVNYKPTGAASFDWSGTGHNEEAFSSVTWLDGDGNDVSVDAIDTINSAEEIIITNVLWSLHPDTGAVHNADVVLRHTASIASLDVYHRHTWLNNGQVTGAPVAMLAVPNSWDYGQVDSDNTGPHQLNNDDGSDVGQLQSQLVALWHPSYDFIAWIWLPNLTGVNNWDDSSPDFLYIEDRNLGTLNKAYAQRVGADVGAVSYLTNDVWESWAEYRVSNIDPNEVDWT